MSKKVTHYAHFTTLEAFESMLNSKENEKKRDNKGNEQSLLFRATIYNQMNDGNECLILRNKYFTESKKKTEMQNDFNNWLKTNGEPFIISFIDANVSNSAKGISKNVPMWQTYGSNGKGIILVFEFDDKIDLKGWKLIKCDYLSNTEADNKVIELNNQKGLNSETLNELFIKTKGKEWEHEKEWRLYKNCNLEEISTYEKTPHRIIECSYFNIPFKYLKRIIIGNQLDFEPSKDEIMQLLKNKGCSIFPKIEQSKLALKD